MNEFVKRIRVALDIDKRDVEDAFDASQVEAAKAKEQEELNAKFEQFGADTKEYFKDLINFPTYTDVLDKIVDYIKGAWESLNDLLGYTQLTDDKTLELWEKGLTGASAYAYEQANDLVGIGDLIEDGWRMNEQQAKAWQAEFQEELDKYNSLYDSGYFEKLQEYQYAMKEFQSDIEYQFMRIFMDNKDTIIKFFDIALKVNEWFLTTFAQFIDGLTSFSKRSESERVSSVNEILKNASNVTQSTAVSVDNTWNIKGNMTENKTDLAHAGQLTYEQIIRALGGSI